MHQNPIEFLHFWVAKMARSAQEPLPSCPAGRSLGARTRKWRVAIREVANMVLGALRGVDLREVAKMASGSSRGREDGAGIFARS